MLPTQNPGLINRFWDRHRVDLVESFRLVVERDSETWLSVSKTDIANFYHTYLIDSQPEFIVIFILKLKYNFNEMDDTKCIVYHLGPPKVPNPFTILSRTWYLPASIPGLCVTKKNRVVLTTINKNIKWWIKFCENGGRITRIWRCWVLGVSNNLPPFSTWHHHSTGIF